MIRTFICIELEQTVKSVLKNVLQDVRDFRSVKWVKPESIHLTLKFLGDVEKRQIAEIANAVQIACQDIHPIKLTLTGFGAFPNFHHARVYWAGIEDSTKNLFTLNKNIETELEKIGFARESRQFSPHLTLGRVKFQDDLTELEKYFQQRENVAAHFVADQIVVMQSELSPAGAKYTPLQQIPLHPHID